MKKQVSEKKKFRHVIFWFISFLFDIWVLIDIGSKMVAIDWIQLIYNCLSIILVFYSVAYLSVRYFSKFSGKDFFALSGYAQIKQLLQPQVLLIIGITIAYIAISIFLDNNYFGYKVNYHSMHISSRGKRILIHVFLAIACGYIKIYRKRRREEKTYDDYCIKILHDHNKTMRDIIRKNRLDDNEDLN